MGTKRMKKEQLFMIVLAGILVLVIIMPVQKAEPEEVPKMEYITEEQKEAEVEQRLKEILQRISGVGKVEIFINYEDRGQLIVEKDEVISEEFIEEADSSGGARKTTTTRTERQTIYDEGEAPYVIRELAPTVKGVLVVAQGGGNTEIKKQIENTIIALFGLDAHKISIMKMEGSK